MRSSNRSTIFSPQIVDVVETRTSSARPSMFISNWPSCGRRRLDDVHVGHDLDAAHERLAHLAGQLDDFVERTVDAEAHPHAIFGGLDVHVGGAVAQRLGDDLVDDLHDRRVRVDDRLDRARCVVEHDVASVAWNASMSVLTANSAL